VNPVVGDLVVIKVVLHDEKGRFVAVGTKLQVFAIRTKRKLKKFDGVRNDGDPEFPVMIRPGDDPVDGVKILGNFVTVEKLER